LTAAAAAVLPLDELIAALTAQTGDAYDSCWSVEVIAAD
jgi:hypothetical protein